MNPILERKLEELKNAGDYECWYLVKQPTEFDGLCYLVSLLKEYKTAHPAKNLQYYISDRLNELKLQNPELEISDNYRALRVAAYFGLIKLNSQQYEDADITETFEEITARCGGKYEDTEKYRDIIKRQIEKMFISSNIDRQYLGVRQNFRLYPVMLLYKVLLELGRSGGNHSISMTEYRYIVATTKTFEDFLETLLLIKLLRDDGENAAAEFEKYREKFDNRLLLALRQLDTLIIGSDTVSLSPDKINEVAEKVFIFEQRPDLFADENYTEFLCSKSSLFDIKKSENRAADLDRKRLTTGRNILLYGVPGSGKSRTIEREYRKPGSKAVRVVFHPDYTYSDFIGQILPEVSGNGQVSYNFAPGPFTNILKDSYNDPETEYILIIEEINRGNAPAIFGEIFQLLDRKFETKDENDDGFPIGTSEYGIINPDIAAVMYDGKEHAYDEVRIPSNLSLIATMNTSDQNVFTLDTAFQRRWEMRLIENSFDDCPVDLANKTILDTGVSWKNFCIGMNGIISQNGLGLATSEDKRLGVHFVRPGDLDFDDRMGDLGSGEYDMLRKKESSGMISSDEKIKLSKIRGAMQQNRKFPEKVIKYLWDDAFRFNREAAFDVSGYQTHEQIIHDFIYAKGFERFKVFSDGVRSMLRDGISG